MVRAAAEFQGLLAALSGDLGTKIALLLSRLDRLDQQELLAFITDAYPELITPYLGAAADLTTTWYDEQPTISKFEARPAELAPMRQLGISGRWAMLQRNPVEALQGTATRAVFNASRETVLENVSAEPGARWARHASANACAFCRLLATRGAVYRSEASAKTVTGRSVNLELSDRRQIAAGLTTREEALERRSTFRSARQAGKQGKNVGDARIGALRGTQKYGDKYHDHCHCIAVMVRPGGEYEPPDYVQQWEQDYIDAVRATREAGETKGPYGAIDVKAVVRNMDQAQKKSEAPTKIAAANAGKPGTASGAKPPVKPPKPPKPPRGASSSAGREWGEDERARRQKALGIETHDERLTQQEVTFVERFLAAGHQLEWIPRDKTRKSTNDFIWLDKDNAKVELKTTKPDYSAIHGRIVDAASRAAKWDVVKDKFMINIADQPLTDGLRTELSGFNIDRRKYRLTDLWVMSQGVVHRIELREN